VPCKKSSDEHGTLYRVPAFVPQSKGKLQPRPHIDVWWDRGSKRSDEDLIIRQENRTDGADCIFLTLGQAYDLIHALGCLIMDK
jgi:hypothetical protein